MLQARHGYRLRPGVRIGRGVGELSADLTLVQFDARVARERERSRVPEARQLTAEATVREDIRDLLRGMSAKI